MILILEFYVIFFSYYFHDQKHQKADSRTSLPRCQSVVFLKSCFHDHDDDEHYYIRFTKHHTIYFETCFHEIWFPFVIVNHHPQQQQHFRWHLRLCRFGLVVVDVGGCKWLVIVKINVTIFMTALNPTRSYCLKGGL